MENHAEAPFIHGSLMRHVTVMSFTASIGLMAIYAVDLIDMIFISMLGQEALAAAAGYASALMFFTSSINIGLSIAAAVLAARAIGADKPREAQEYATSTAMFALVTGLILPFPILMNVEYLLGLLGATGDVAGMAASYLWIIIPFTFVSGLSMVAVSVLRGYGENQRAMYPSLLGALTNAALDPILIFALGLGLQGAAWATVAARFVTLGFALWPAVKRHQAFIRPQLSWLWRDLVKVSQFAIPAVLANVATPVGNAIVTREMAKYGPDAVAGMAVIGRITPVAFSVVMALYGAIGPIIGQNYGAGLLDRVRGAFMSGLKFVAMYVIFVAAVLFLFRDYVAAVFGAEDMARTLLFLFCGPLALASFFNGAIFVASASFSNLGRPSYATWLNWGRNTLGTWPFVIGMAAIWGAPGVLIGQAAGGVIFAGIAVWLGLRIINDPPKEHEHKKHPFHHHHFGHHHYRLHLFHHHGRG